MQLVSCDQCDRSYHMSCHIPQILNVPPKDTKWLCSACDLSQSSMKNGQMRLGNVSGFRNPDDVTSPLQPNNNVENTNTNIKSSRSGANLGIGGLPTPNGSGESTDEDMNSVSSPPTLLPPIPSGMSERIDEWSIQDVANYFRSAGFPDQAQLVSEQEIDGAALLLLKRDDIIHELGFKLGPALKIYQITAALQRKTVLATTCNGSTNDQGDQSKTSVMV